MPDRGGGGVESRGGTGGGNFEVCVCALFPEELALEDPRPSSPSDAAEAALRSEPSLAGDFDGELLAVEPDGGVAEGPESLCGWSAWAFLTSLRSCLTSARFAPWVLSPMLNITAPIESTRIVTAPRKNNCTGVSAAVKGPQSIDNGSRPLVAKVT